MQPIEASVDIQRAPEVVYALVSDPGNDPRWQTDVVEVSSASEAASGQVPGYRWVVDFLGRQTASLVPTRCQPHQLVELVATVGHMQVTFTYLFEPQAGGTRVTSRVEVACWMANLAGPALTRLIRRRQSRHLTNLKNLLEHRPVDTSREQIDLYSELCDGFS